VALHAEHSELPADLHALRDAIDRDRKRVTYLRDVLRYGLEYLLYRQAQQHRRAGHYAQAAAGYRRCIAGAQQTMGRLLIDQLSTDLNTLSPDALKQKKPGALPGESPYTAAARLYEALCLIELGDAKRAVELLHAFVAEDPATVLPTPAQQAELDRTLLEDRVPVAPPLLYRGEALRELGRLALEHELDLDRAEAYFARLDHWLRQARVDSSGWDYASKLPGIKAAAKVRTDGPRAEYQKPDFWGNVRASKLDPGMLVNRRTTPWYLDDLEEDCAKFRGFVHFARGDGEKALAQWRRIIALDTEAKDGDLATSPNNFTRLKFGAEHGYLIAYPQELALYPGRLRTAVMLGDFYYVTQQHHRATMTCERLLEGAYETLSPAQHDYVHFLLGSVIYRHRSTGKRRHTTIDAINCWMKILEHRDDTWTEPRSAVTISNVSRMVGDPEIQDAGRALLLAAAKSNQDHPSVHEARIILAFDLMWERRDGEARRWLDRVPESAGKKYERAQNIVMQLDDPESNLWKFLQRNEP